MTQKQLGVLIGISESYVNLIENNKTDPRYSIIAKIAKYLGICPKEIIIGFNGLECITCVYNEQNK